MRIRALPTVMQPGRTPGAFKGPNRQPHRPSRVLSSGERSELTHHTSLKGPTRIPTGSHSRTPSHSAWPARLLDHLGARTTDALVQRRMLDGVVELATLHHLRVPTSSYSSEPRHLARAHESRAPRELSAGLYTRDVTCGGCDSTGCSPRSAPPTE